MASQTVPEGKYTETVYNLIKDQKYGEAIQILNIELQSFPRSRAALSLLGHCYYMLQDYANAVAMYEMLVTFYGEVEEYKVYYAQSLYKAGMYAEATRAALRVESEQYGQRMMMLQAGELFLKLFLTIRKYGIRVHLTYLNFSHGIFFFFFFYLFTNTIQQQQNMNKMILLVVKHNVIVV